MSSPCNNLNVVPIKVSKLVRYQNIDTNDFFLTIESGSALYSRKSTFGDLIQAVGKVTGSYTGSFSGSFKGKASGSFSGSYWGNIVSKNTNTSGSFSGSYWGNIVSKNTNASGSFSGSYWGGVISKNTKATGSFRGSLVSTNTIASGSFSGSYWGRILSKNTIASGSFSGSHYGKLFSKTTIASGSFSGSHYGKVIGSNGSLITGSFRGIDNINNFKGTGKKVSFNGTASYSVSSSYAQTASYLAGGTGGTTFANASYSVKVGAGSPTSAGTPNNFGSINATGKTLKWFKIEGSFNVGENDSVLLYGVSLGGTLVSTNVYSSWGWGHGYGYDPDNGNIITHFTIEGAPPPGVTTGTIAVTVHVGGSPSNVYGYAVGYF